MMRERGLSVDDGWRGGEEKEMPVPAIPRNFSTGFAPALSPKRVRTLLHNLTIDEGRARTGCG